MTKKLTENSSEPIGNIGQNLKAYEKLTEASFDTIPFGQLDMKSLKSNKTIMIVFAKDKHLINWLKKSLKSSLLFYCPSGSHFEINCGSGECIQSKLK